MAKRPPQMGERDNPQQQQDAPRRPPAPVEVPEELAKQLRELARSQETTTDQVLSEALETLLRVQSESAQISQPRSAKASTRAASASRAAVVKNRTKVIRSSNAIIRALEEALSYDPMRQHNEAPPELWIDDQAYFTEMRQLVSELRTLNALLRSLASPEREYNAVINFARHADKFLEGFSAVTGKGAGILLVAAIGGLLYQTGIVPDIAESVFRQIRLR